MIRLVEVGNKKYELRLLSDGLMAFSVFTSNGTRRLHTAPVQARILAAVIEADHAEALEMNIGVDNEINTAALPIAEIRGTAELCEAHEEALEINTQIDEELAKLCRVIAGVRRSSFGVEAKADLIGAASRGLVDGLRERLGVKIDRYMLADLAVRACK